MPEIPPPIIAIRLGGREEVSKGMYRPNSGVRMFLTSIRWVRCLGSDAAFAKFFEFVFAASDPIAIV
jgi:hypothetical protein